MTIIALEIIALYGNRNNDLPLLEDLSQHYNQGEELLLSHFQKEQSKIKPIYYAKKKTVSH